MHRTEPLTTGGVDNHNIILHLATTIITQELSAFNVQGLQKDGRIRTMNAVSRNNTSAHLYLTAIMGWGVRRDGVPDNRVNREPTSGPPLEMLLPNLKMGGYNILLKCINVLSSLNTDRFAMDGWTEIS